MHKSQAGALAAVAALDEPTRRRLYEYVVRRPAPVSRDDVASALAVPRATVAFHLDRLVEEQLLVVEYVRRSGRTGPGAGRPAKLYRRSDRQVSVSVPERHYELAGGLLASAIEEADESGGRGGAAGRDEGAGRARGGGGRPRRAPPPPPPGARGGRRCAGHRRRARG